MITKNIKSVVFFFYENFFKCFNVTLICVQSMSHLFFMSFHLSFQSWNAIFFTYSLKQNFLWFVRLKNEIFWFFKRIFPATSVLYLYFLFRILGEYESGFKISHMFIIHCQFSYIICAINCQKWGKVLTNVRRNSENQSPHNFFPFSKKLSLYRQFDW